MERPINDIVETLKEGNNHGRGCTLLIGAGCSVTAGIPTAAGFVEHIKGHHNSAYQRAGSKTYPHCMYELSPGQRRDLIAQYVDGARINWGHVAIAQLMKCGYVDRILTTNFDPLLVKACALVGEFPAVYDFAASQAFKPADVPEKAIFYLHGQRSGFKLLHTQEDMESLGKSIQPVFRDAGRGRTWIVVGYSGENDPVFTQLAQVECYDHNFYWVAYKDSVPGEHVRKLLGNKKRMYQLQGYDSDGFFTGWLRNWIVSPQILFHNPSHICLTS